MFDTLHASRAFGVDLHHLVSDDVDTHEEHPVANEPVPQGLDDLELPLRDMAGVPCLLVLAPQEEVTAIQRMYHVTTFVPPELVDSLLDGVLREVPLTYGRYDRSAWWSAVGIEQFRPLPGSTPTVGRAGQVERVPTVRLEFVIPHDPDLLERVLNRGLIANHPWEEPAVLVSTTHTTASNPDKLRPLDPRADRG